MAPYLRRARAPIQQKQTPPTPLPSSAQPEAEHTDSSKPPHYTDDRPPLRLSESPLGEQLPEEQHEEDPPEWVRSIMGDRSTTLITKLRAALIGVGLMGPEQKSEEEFVEELSASNKEDNPAAAEPGLSSDEAAKQMTEVFIRNRAVDKAKSLMGADWHAPAGSEARKKADTLHKGDPQEARNVAMKAGMLWAFEQQDSLQRVKEEAETRYKKKKSPKARETAEAATEVLTALAASLKEGSLAEHQYSPGTADFAESAWRYLGSEKTKKHLEKLGFPLAWFTTCVTLINPVAQAAGVDTKKWGPLDMFDKRRQERFKEAQASRAWVPAEKKQQPKPGDILIFVSYQKTSKGAIQKEISKAFFQHVAVLIEPVKANDDGTEQWVTADGGKGSSHLGEDKTGLTVRRYNPNTQQFITGTHSNLQEAAEGGRYLLGFWSLPRLPMRTDIDPNTGAKR